MRGSCRDRTWWREWACALKTAALAGSDDGTSVDQSVSSAGYALDAKGFTGYIGTRGRIEVTLASAGVRSDGTGSR